MTEARTLDTQEIVQKLKSDDARKLFADNHVLAAYLFGSVAEGRTHAHSDVDVAIAFQDSVPESEYSDRRFAIILGVMGLLKFDDVDVVPLNRAPLLLVHEALKQPVTIYVADQEKASEFEIMALGRYWDFREHQKVICKMTREAARSG
jgi:predicted nucleotidyltransferase